MEMEGFLGIHDGAMNLGGCRGPAELQRDVNLIVARSADGVFCRYEHNMR